MILSNGKTSWWLKTQKHLQIITLPHYVWLVVMMFFSLKKSRQQLSHYCYAIFLFTGACQGFFTYKLVSLFLRLECTHSPNLYIKMTSSVHRCVQFFWGSNLFNFFSFFGVKKCHFWVIQPTFHLSSSSCIVILCHRAVI